MTANQQIRDDAVRASRLCFALVACAWLAGCGGGDDSPAPPTGFNLDAAFTALLTQGASFPGLQGTSSFGGTTTAVTESHTYRPSGGQSTVHTVVSESAGTSRTTSETLQYTASPLAITAITNEAGTIHYQLVAPLPTSAQVGSTGQYEQGIEAPSSQLLWSVEAGPTPDTAWACLSKLTLSGAGGSGTSTCLNLDMAGHILRARYGYQAPFQSGYTVQ